MKTTSSTTSKIATPVSPSNTTTVSEQVDVAPEPSIRYSALTVAHRPDQKWFLLDRMVDRKTLWAPAKYVKESGLTHQGWYPIYIAVDKATEDKLEASDWQPSRHSEMQNL